jgi:hypothetical protein
MSNLITVVFHTAIYIQPVHFFLAITTNIFNIRILCSRALRSSPCTHYFLAYAIFSIIYTCLLCPTQFIRGFSINWASSTFGCRMQFYILYVIPFQANLMLIFASFDRYCSSSSSNLLHSTSTIRTAKVTIVVGTILCAVYMSPMLAIYYWSAIVNICIPISNTLVNAYIFSQVIVYYILAPLLLIILVLLTISNIRQQTARLAPLTTPQRHRRTEKQLARMLLLQVGVHLVFALPYGITYCMNSFDPSTQTPNIIGMRLAFVMWQQCDYFMSFFLYILSGRVYRRKFIRIVKSIKC